jgi:hypothetical protein
MRPEVCCEAARSSAAIAGRLCNERARPHLLRVCSLALGQPTDILSREQKGFPDETHALQPALEKYFAQFGRVNVVRMRRDAATRAFKHSVFIEFAEFAEMEKFVALGKLPDDAPEHPKWEDGTPLVLMTK